jgi:hypothetical protein
MKRFEKGSEWRKWDLHLHTPSSFDYKDKSVNNNDIITKIKEKGISCAVVSDHNIIDIERIKELKRLAEVANITILPGLELRSELGGSESIHFICIFPETCNLDEIWTDLQSKCNLKPSDITSKGHECIVCDLANTADLVHSLGGLISVHAGTKTNSIENIKNTMKYKMAQKTELAREMIDIYEIGKPEDESGYQKIVFPCIKKEMPMIIGSDNHDIKNYNPQVYTWIKSDPTFEGLKQIIYEPKGRVKINSDLPEPKNEYQVINRVRFCDSQEKDCSFTNNWIELNKGLNSIIGGKSSGKSLLLYHIAKTIDEERINEINKDSTYNQIAYNIDENEYFDFEVEWCDGKKYKLKDAEKPVRPITYIPQLYLNRLAEDKKAELNTLVEKMLYDSYEDYREYRTKNEESINVEKTELGTALRVYFDNLDLLLLKQTELKQLGDKDAIKANITLIESQVASLRAESSFTPEEEISYKTLLAEIEVIQESIVIEERLIKALENANSRILTLYSIENIASVEEVYKRVCNDDFSLKEQDKQLIRSIIDGIAVKIRTYAEKVIEEAFGIMESKSVVVKQRKEEKNKKEKELEPFSNKVKNQERFIALEKSRLVEEAKIKQIQAKENEIIAVKELLDIGTFYSHYEKICALYKDILEETKKYSSIPDSDNLLINARVKFNKEKFEESVIGKVNRKTALASQFGDYFDENEDYKFNFESHVADYCNMINSVFSGNARLRSSYTTRDLISAMLEDFIEIDYNLVQYGDDLLKMSPGKRGIILFQLFLHLSKSSDPILIDQPEDNLDNRTVYQELNEFIKAKKIKRQIIIVSHNPNLVVSTDSENVIVANQQGQNKAGSNDGTKFDYVSGSLEYSYIDEKQKGILHQKGIREHVCEILEGGQDAFEKREDKYGMRYYK